MPLVRKLASEEVQSLYNKGKGQRKLVEEQYDAILSDYVPGEYGEALLDSDEHRLTVRNRLRAAATRRQLAIAFRRAAGDIVRFQIIEHSNGNNTTPAGVPPVVVASAPPAKKGGRPKKSA